MKKKNKRTVYEYKTPKDCFIKVSVLKKAPKGHYKNDIISIEIKSINFQQELFLTPKEALVICSGLNIGVIECEQQEKRLLQ